MTSHPIRIVHHYKGAGSAPGLPLRPRSCLFETRHKFWVADELLAVPKHGITGGGELDITPWFARRCTDAERQFDLERLSIGRSRYACEMIFLFHYLVFCLTVGGWSSASASCELRQELQQFMSGLKIALPVIVCLCRYRPTVSPYNLQLTRVTNQVDTTHNRSEICRGEGRSVRGHLQPQTSTSCGF